MSKLRWRTHTGAPSCRSKLHLRFASDHDTFSEVPGTQQPRTRSGCPLSVSLELLGDRWSLLIIRDLMVRGYHTFGEFQNSGEGIATNILADRLRKLEAAGIIRGMVGESDARRIEYNLTEKGIDLAPVVLEMFLWAARHEKTGASCSVIDQMHNHRDALLAEVRRRWQEHDRTPVLPVPPRPQVQARKANRTKTQRRLSV